jgi:hypothetical protein
MVVASLGSPIPDVNYYSHNFPEEAVYYAKLALRAWKAVPGAIDWKGN